MCNNQVDPDITGVNEEKAKAPLEVCTKFYPIVGFELSTENPEAIKKYVELVHFTKSDEFAAKKKPYLAEEKYKHLKPEAGYFISLLKIIPSDKEDRTVKLVCATSAGKDNCSPSGDISIKLLNPNIKGISISKSIEDKVLIGNVFVIDIIIAKDIDVNQFEKFNTCPLIFTVKNEDEEIEVGKIHLLVETIAKQHIFLLGSSTYGTQSTFTSQMNLRKNRILKSKKPNEKYVFYAIDVPKGKIHKYEYPGNEKGELFTDCGKFDFIERTNYIDNRFVSGSKTIISKTDVYKLIESIGTDMPGSVCDFAIFSHAQSGGAILVNSNQRSADGTDNSDDHDMRKSDYITIDCTLFASAFSDKGAIYNLGCNNSPHLNNILKQVMKSTKYKADGSTLDDTAFTLNDMPFGGVNISAYAGNNKKDLDKGRFEMTMLDLKKTMALYFINTYAAYMAKYVNVKVVSSVPATYSVFVDSTTNKPVEFRISGDTKMNAPFFKSYLDIEITNEGYGVFTKNKVEEMETLVGQKI